MYKVFELRSAKWLIVDSNNHLEIKYSANEKDATIFNKIELASANEFFYNFSMHKNTLRAVPLGNNKPVYECHTVLEQIRLNRQRYNEEN